MKTQKVKYPQWTRIPWDGNPSLKLECWRKTFGRGHVSVGIGGFKSIVHSFGADSDRSYSGTRARPGPATPDLTEEEAMAEVDAQYAKRASPGSK